jgi:hypothetical protein
MLTARQTRLADFTSIEQHPMWILQEHFLSNVIGKVNYNKMKSNKCISSYITVSDEAFALLCIDNVYGKLVSDVYKGENGPNKLKWVGVQSPQKISTTKYTNKNGDDDTSSSTSHQSNSSPVYMMKFQGWSELGLANFDKWCKNVAFKRKSDMSKQIEEVILQRHQELKGEGKKKEKQQKRNIEQSKYKPFQTYGYVFPYVLKP